MAYAIVASDRQGNIEVVDSKLTIVPYFWNADTLAYEVATVNATTGTGQEVVVTNVPPVSQSGAWTVGLSSGTQTIGTVAQGSPGSSASPWWIRETNPSTGGGAGSTEVDVKSITPSTAHIGDVSISSGSVSVSSGAVLGVSTAQIGNVGFAASTIHIGDVSISSGSVSVTSGTVLGPSTAAIGLISSGSQTIGTVINSSSTATIGNVSVSSGAILGASTAVIGGISSGTVLGPSTAATGQISSGTQTIGTVINASGEQVIGTVVQGSAGSTANAWNVQAQRFSSAAVSRTTVNTSQDASLIGANANRKALIIASLSTAQTCAIGLTTAAMTTALANVTMYMPANTQLIFGLPGTLPLYQGPIRGVNITSTAVAGGVSVTEFT